MDRDFYVVSTQERGASWVGPQETRTYFATKTGKRPANMKRHLVMYRKADVQIWHIFPDLKEAILETP